MANMYRLSAFALQGVTAPKRNSVPRRATSRPDAEGPEPNGVRPYFPMQKCSKICRSRSSGAR
jgi:hypothetical protein